MVRRKFTIVSVYDTETCNVGEGENTRAYPVLFIDNDIRDKDLYNYEAETDDKINFYRTEEEMQARIDEYIQWGKVVGEVPIICAYNLMFDLQPLMEDLNRRYDIQANAQSSTNVYTVDLYEQETDKMLLRFWDTYHLEMRGLAAMGKTCGLEKAVGDWDYSLIRTPQTPLTEQELYYAARDVQVIPAYLRYLLHANEWMKQSDLGSRVLTKTSIVRQMARREIAQLKIDKKNGKVLTLDKAFMEQCKKELPKTYGIYALRKACFRGGFTFTAAATASQLTRNVASLDVTSMHHTFINGRYVPQDFSVEKPQILRMYCERIFNTTREEIMSNYHKPFDCAIHARIRFHNIRLRKGSCFEKWGIALESTSKFKREQEAGSGIGLDERAVAQENSVRSGGWYDQFSGKVTFAFGKLYEGENVVLHLNEIELWNVSRVYEWDSYEVIGGEVTRHFKLPPDYVTLQSNKLFEQKSAAKFISSHYVEGEPYKYNLTGIPDGIAESLRNGTCKKQFFDSWYTSTVKGMFNGIYGTMAQDIYKPTYKCSGGSLVIDESTITTAENWESKQPSTCRVFYNYGMRIVGGSRMHLVIAMELVYEHFHERVRVLGGDTDSLKVSCDPDVTDDELEESLRPIADCSKRAIDKCMQRLRSTFRKFASTLSGIGSFDIENRGAHYDYHVEAWNKARVSYDGKAHITCAGLSRPINQYHIETFINDLIRAGNPIEDVLLSTLTYNVYISNEICHSLESRHPQATDRFIGLVKDYLGDTHEVNVHQSTALYPCGRWIGDTDKITNAFSLGYLRREYGRCIDERAKYVMLRGGTVPVIALDPSANNVLIGA